MSLYSLVLLIGGAFLGLALLAHWLMRRTACGCTCSRDRCDRAVRETESAARLTEHALDRYSRTPNG